MGDCTSAKNIYKMSYKHKRGVWHVEPMCKKIKNYRETRHDQGGTESDDCQILNLPDESCLSRDEGIEVLSIEDDEEVTEIKETEDERPKRKKAKQKRQEIMGGGGAPESDDCQIVNLPDESGMSGVESDEMLLVRDDPNAAEMKETDGEQHDTASEDEHCEDSEEDIGASSESELEGESEAPEEQQFTSSCGNESRRRLSKRLTRDIELAEIEEGDGVLAKQIKELRIVIDWVPSRLHQMKASVNAITRQEKQKFKEAGITVKRGAWTLEEELKLAENWLQFSKQYKIRNPRALLGLKENFRCSNFLGLDFVMYLGQGLDDRPLISIYQRARRLLDPGSYRGRFSDSEWELLKKLVAKYGRKWTLISKSMDRSASACLNYYRTNATEYNRGRWTIAEDKCLIRAVARVSKGKDLTKAHHHIPWTEVEKLVKTRHQSQCYERWMYTVSWITCGNLSQKIWKTEDNIQLIKTIRDSAYQSTSDIPWHSMYEQFGLVNCFQLKKKWDCLRMRVPNFYIKPFNEIVDWLVENHLPVLEQRLKDRKRNRLLRAKMEESRQKRKEEKVAKQKETDGCM